jgi:hypothetical protein
MDSILHNGLEANLYIHIKNQFLFILYKSIIISGLTIASVFGQTVNLSGTVTTIGGTAPLNGVVVTLKGKALSDTTDINGSYMIQQPATAIFRLSSGENFTKPIISGNVLSFSSAKEQKIAIKIYSLNGRAIVNVATWILPGVYRFDLSGLNTGMGYYHVMISFSDHVLYLHYLSFSKQRKTAAGNISFVPKIELGKISAAVDSLIFLKAGYNSVRIGIDSLTGIVNIQMVPAIGQNYGGGIVFYLDSTGQHGLIAAPYDQTPTAQYTGVEWGCSGKAVGATGTAIGTGQSNTNKILSGCPSAGAATLCDQLVLGGYSDWYLSSRDELLLMYTNLVFQKANPVGGFSSNLNGYWSSTETGIYAAWVTVFSGQPACYAVEKSGTDPSQYSAFVRAIRSF